MIALLLATASRADAAFISIVGTPYLFSNGGMTFTPSANRISLTDFFDRHNETRWAIASAVDTASGGVSVTYNFASMGILDFYGARADIEFQILPDSGSATPEPVALDFWGSSFYRHQFRFGCCFSDAPEIRLSGPGLSETHIAPGNGAFDTFNETLNLLTHTTYRLEYSNSQYVEGSPLSNDLPTHFVSRALYDAWVADRGTSGSISASSIGVLNYNLALRPSSVPEPGTFALLGAGLAGLLLARRRGRSPAAAESGTCGRTATV